MNTTSVTRRNRKTGLIVSAMNDTFLGWVTTCETHGTYCEHNTRTAAISWLAEPTVWCSDCAEITS